MTLVASRVWRVWRVLLSASAPTPLSISISLSVYISPLCPRRQYLVDKYNSKSKLEELVVRLGGTITQNNMGDSTDFIIAASDANLRVRGCACVLCSHRCMHCPCSPCDPRAC